MNGLNINSRKIGRQLFFAILIFNGLLAFGFSIITLLNYPYALEVGFGISYRSEMDVLGLIMGCQLMLLASLNAISFIWTRSGKVDGPTIGMAAGIYLVVFGLFAFFRLGDITALGVDTLRGLLTVAAAFLARQELGLELEG